MPVLATTRAIRGLQCLTEPALVVMDSAEDWINFLNSSEADQLATQIPSEDLQKQFDVDQHAPLLDKFIMDVVLPGGTK